MRSEPQATTQPGAGFHYEFWKHDQSGEVYAVRLDPEGRITGCHGPLVSDELHLDALAAYPYDANPADLAWIEEHRETWAPFEFTSPPHYGNQFSRFEPEQL